MHKLLDIQCHSVNETDPIPGCVRVFEGNVQVAIVVVELQVFQEYSRTVVDMAEQRRLWILKNKR
jgi:hypothetical protein